VRNILVGQGALESGKWNDKPCGYTVVKVGQYSEIYPVVWMTCSYREGKIPKLIVRDIFWSIPRLYGDIKNKVLLEI
jgi:hypothetical protein